MSMLYKFTNIFDVETKSMVYNALIQSQLNYLTMIYAYKELILKFLRDFKTKL